MEVEHTQLLPGPREAVWDRLMDFEVLARTLPGIERLDPLGPDTCALVARVIVPSITGTYEGKVEVVEKEPIDRYRLRGEARGRLGWVRGDAQFRLESLPDGTSVTARMDFHAGGMLRSVGQRFMEAVARSMLRDFFAAFEKELTPDGVGAGEH